jgi:hypothetical protein
MNCIEHRKSLLAQPAQIDASARQHLLQCVDCTRFHEKLHAFESRLSAALRVPVGHHNRAVLQPERRSRMLRPSRGWLAMAASALLALAIGSLWLGAPSRSLAAAVVDHVADEPAAYAPSNRPVSPENLDVAFSDTHSRMKPDAFIVTYASRCDIRGHRVVHLVVQTGHGPMTVMILMDEAVRRSVRFDQQGYRGVLVPLPLKGSVAVLERDSDSAGSDAVSALAASVASVMESG